MAAQWIFCAVFSLSIAFVSFGQLVTVGPPTTVKCIVGPVMRNLGSGAAISSLFVKMWRVLALWKAGMKRVRINNRMLFT